MGIQTTSPIYILLRQESTGLCALEQVHVLRDEAVLGLKVVPALWASRDFFYKVVAALRAGPFWGIKMRLHDEQCHF